MPKKKGAGQEKESRPQTSARGSSAILPAGLPGNSFDKVPYGTDAPLPIKQEETLEGTNEDYMEKISQYLRESTRERDSDSGSSTEPEPSEDAYDPDIMEVDIPKKIVDIPKEIVCIDLASDSSRPASPDEDKKPTVPASFTKPCIKLETKDTVTPHSLDNLNKNSNILHTSPAAADLSHTASNNSVSNVTIKPEPPDNVETHSATSTPVLFETQGVKSEESLDRSNNCTTNMKIKTEPFVGNGNSPMESPENSLHQTCQNSSSEKSNSDSIYKKLSLKRPTPEVEAKIDQLKKKLKTEPMEMKESLAEIVDAVSVSPEQISEEMHIDSEDIPQIQADIDHGSSNIHIENAEENTKQISSDSSTVKSSSVKSDSPAKLESTIRPQLPTEHKVPEMSSEILDYFNLEFELDINEVERGINSLLEFPINAELYKLFSAPAPALNEPPSEKQGIIFPTKKIEPVISNLNINNIPAAVPDTLADFGFHPLQESVSRPSTELSPQLPENGTSSPSHQVRNSDYSSNFGIGLEKEFEKRISSSVLKTAILTQVVPLNNIPSSERDVSASINQPPVIRSSIVSTQQLNPIPSVERIDNLPTSQTPISGSSELSTQQLQEIMRQFSKCNTTSSQNPVSESESPNLDVSPVYSGHPSHFVAMPSSSASCMVQPSFPVHAGTRSPMEINFVPNSPAVQSSARMQNWGAPFVNIGQNVPVVLNAYQTENTCFSNSSPASDPPPIPIPENTQQIVPVTQINSQQIPHVTNGNGNLSSAENSLPYNLEHSGTANGRKKKISAATYAQMRASRDPRIKKFHSKEFSDPQNNYDSFGRDNTYVPPAEPVSTANFPRLPLSPFPGLSSYLNPSHYTANHDPHSAAVTFDHKKGAADSNSSLPSVQPLQHLAVTNVNVVNQSRCSVSNDVLNSGSSWGLNSPHSGTSRDPRSGPVTFDRRKGEADLNLYKKIGKDNITKYFYLLVLQWNPRWLHTQMTTGKCPPICESYPAVKFSYNNGVDYYNTYVPLLFLSVWQSIFDCWRAQKGLAFQFQCESKQDMMGEIKFICSAELLDSEQQYWPKREDIALCKTNKDEVFVRVLTVMTKPLTQTKKKLRMEIVALKPFVIEIGKISNIYVLHSVRVNWLQSTALLSITPCMKDLVLNPKKNKKHVTFIKLQNDRNYKKQRDDIVDATKQAHILVSVLEVPKPHDRIMTIINIAFKYSHILNEKVLICLKNDATFYKLFESLKQYGPLLAVRTKEMMLDPNQINSIMTYTIDHHLNKPAASSDVIKKGKLFLTTVSSFNNAQGEKSPLLKEKFVCIIDEAHLCPEGETCLLLQLNLKKLLLFANRDEKLVLPEELKRKRYDVTLYSRLLQSS